MPLLAYVDESGKFHDGAGFICLCGWLADSRGWARLNDTWNRLLASARWSGIHLTQFYSQSRLRGLSETQADEILLPFIEAIRENVLVGFAIGLDGQHFRRKFITAGRSPQDPQLFAVHRLLHAMRDYCNDWAVDPTVPPRISITFDEDEEYSIGVYRTISRLRRLFPEVKRLIGAISFGDDEVYSPLQAADILANLTNRYMRERMSSPGDKPPKPPALLQRLLSPLASGKGLMYGEELWDASEIDSRWPQIAAGKPL